MGYFTRVIAGLVEKPLSETVFNYIRIYHRIMISKALLKLLKLLKLLNKMMIFEIMFYLVNS
jgi:hypothetical protein